jgi:hypothetical protein
MVPAIGEKHTPDIHKQAGDFGCSLHYFPNAGLFIFKIDQNSLAKSDRGRSKRQISSQP